MSEYQIARIPRLRLMSFEPLAEALGIKDFQHPSEHLTSSARVSALGESLSAQLGHFRNNFQNLSDIKDPKMTGTITSIERGISLREALSEDKHSLLNALVQRQLSKDGNRLEILNKAHTLLEKNDFKSLIAMRSDIDTVVNTLSRLSNEAHIKLMNVEHKIIIEKTEKAMNALGYQVQKKAKGEGCLIRAKKEDLSIATHVTSEGQIHIDMAGFEGGACKKELDKVNAEFAKHGIDLDITQREYHGKKSGGVLMEEVERAMTHEFNPLKEPVKKIKKGHLRRLINLSHLLRQRMHR